MSANQADANNKISVRAMCRVLGVSASGYYDWLNRAPSARAIANAVLTESIRQAHNDSDETYGMPRIRAELRDRGQQVSRKRVARLMSQACIRGVSRRRAFTVTTERDRRQRPAPDLVNRRFGALGLDQLWVADMTYIPTWTGFLYLAVVIDAFSRKVVGWSMGENMTAELVLAALNMALHAYFRPWRTPFQGEGGQHFKLKADTPDGGSGDLNRHTLPGFFNRSRRCQHQGST